jgi:hypothetical protein
MILTGAPAKPEDLTVPIPAEKQEEQKETE